jgi:hypothetical protein
MVSLHLTAMVSFLSVRSVPSAKPLPAAAFGSGQSKQGMQAGQEKAGQGRAGKGRAAQRRQEYSDGGCPGQTTAHSCEWLRNPTSLLLPVLEETGSFLNRSSAQQVKIISFPILKQL